MSVADRLRALSWSQALIFGLIIAGLYYLVGYDTGAALQAQIETTRTSIKDAQAKIVEEEKKLVRIEQYKKATATMGESFRTLLTYIPAKLATFDLLKSVSNEAKAASVNISNLADSGSPIEAGFYTELTVHVELRGTFQQMMLFLSFLTRSDQFMTVQNLSLNAEDSRSLRESPNLRLSADVHGYRYNQEASKK